MEEKITYNNTDISEEVSANAVTYDMNCGSDTSDTLSISFDYDSDRWDKWNTKIDDVVEYQNGDISTGKMFVAEKGISNEQFYLFCTSIPSRSKYAHTKSWENVYLEQVFNEVCKRFGFKFVRKCENQYYKYLAQENESDISFLAKMAKLEGCCMIARDETIYLYQEKELEKAESTIELETEDGDFDVSDQKTLYGQCQVFSGKYKGLFVGEKEKSQFTRTVKSNSDAECYRFAKNLLRNRNKNLVSSCRLKTDIEKSMTAGITANLKSSTQSWNNQTVFVYRVRHEYHSDTTKVFMRKRLEGY